MFLFPFFRSILKPNMLYLLMWHDNLAYQELHSHQYRQHLLLVPLPPINWIVLFFILLDIVQLFCVLFLVILCSQLIYFTSEEKGGLTCNWSSRKSWSNFLYVLKSWFYFFFFSLLKFRILRSKLSWSNFVMSRKWKKVMVSMKIIAHENNYFFKHCFLRIEKQYKNLLIRQTWLVGFVILPQINSSWYCVPFL